MAKGYKTGGRETGTPNKLSRELKDLLKSILEKEIEHLPRQLEKLETKDRLELLPKLLPFVLPKQESIKGDFNNLKNIKQVVIELPPEEE